MKQHLDCVQEYMSNLFPYGIFITFIAITSLVYHHLVIQIFPQEDKYESTDYFKDMSAVSNWWTHKYLIIGAMESFIFISQRYYQIQDFIPIFLENYVRYFFWHFIVIFIALQETSFIEDNCLQQKLPILEVLMFASFSQKPNSCGQIFRHYATQNSNFTLLLLVYAGYITLSKKFQLKITINQILLITTLINSVVYILQILVLSKTNVDQHFFFAFQSVNSPVYFLSAYISSLIFKFDHRREDFTQQLLVKVEDTYLFKKLEIISKTQNFGDISVVTLIGILNSLMSNMFPNNTIAEYSFIIYVRIILSKFLFFVVEIILPYLFLFNKVRLFRYLFESFQGYYDNNKDHLTMVTNAIILLQRRQLSGFEFGPSSNVINFVFCIGITCQVYVASQLMYLCFGKITCYFQQQIRNNGNKTKIKYIRKEGRDDS